LPFSLQHLPKKKAATATIAFFYVTPLQEKGKSNYCHLLLLLYNTPQVKGDDNHHHLLHFYNTCHRRKRVMVAAITFFFFAKLAKA
jgi:hypothetical protein